jgi:hypothetical protein
LKDDNTPPFSLDAWVSKLWYDKLLALEADPLPLYIELELPLSILTCTISNPKEAQLLDLKGSLRFPPLFFEERQGPSVKSASAPKSFKDNGVLSTELGMSPLSFLLNC